jgi:hypothetical protein
LHKVFQSPDPCPFHPKQLVALGLLMIGEVGDDRHLFALLSQQHSLLDLSAFGCSQLAQFGPNATGCLLQIIYIFLDFFSIFYFYFVFHPLMRVDFCLRA